MSAESLPVRTLLRIAKQSGQADESRCALLLSMVTTGRMVRNDLQRFFAAQGLSDLKFCALLVLYTFDPEPSTSADIAYHTDVSRPAITDVIDQLEARRWIARKRDRDDRRIIYVSLTPAGRTRVQELIPAFLNHISELALDVDPAEREIVTCACEKLQQRAHPPAR